MSINETSPDKIKMFQLLTKDEVDQIMTLFELKHYEKDTIIIEEDTVLDRLYLIKKGVVSIYKNINDIDSFVTMLGWGYSIGECSITTGRPATAKVVVSESIDVWETSKDKFCSYIEKKPGLYNKILKGILIDLVDRVELTNFERAAIAIL